MMGEGVLRQVMVVGGSHQPHSHRCPELQLHANSTQCGTSPDIGQGHALPRPAHTLVTHTFAWPSVPCHTHISLHLPQHPPQPPTATKWLHAAAAPAYIRQQHVLCVLCVPQAAAFAVV